MQLGLVMVKDNSMYDIPQDVIAVVKARLMTQGIADAVMAGVDYAFDGISPVSVRWQNFEAEDLTTHEKKEFNAYTLEIKSDAPISMETAAEIALVVGNTLFTVVTQSVSFILLMIDGKIATEEQLSFLVSAAKKHLTKQ